MASPPADRRSLLRQENSDLSDTSIAINSPTIPFPHQRHAYQRMGSGAQDEYADPAPQYTSPTGVGATVRFDSMDDELTGLGIIDRTNTIPRVPVGSRRQSVTPVAPSSAYAPQSQEAARASPNSNSNPSAPNSSNPLLSPAAWTRQPTRHGSGSFAYDTDRIEPLREVSLSDQDIRKKKTAFSESIDVAFGDSDGDGEGRPSTHNDNDDHDHDDQARKFVYILSTKLRADSCRSITFMSCDRRHSLQSKKLALDFDFNHVCLFYSIFRNMAGNSSRSTKIWADDTFRRKSYTRDGVNPFRAFRQKYRVVVCYGICYLPRPSLEQAVAGESIPWSHNR